ncbi:MAG: hypothetical protein ACNS60_02350 [Candidatus Cyclobacteriaceae bacterium M2_1C_046]
MTIQTINPKINIAITEFDLKEAFKYREDELYQLQDFVAQHVDEEKYNSILDVNFNGEGVFDLPENWIY